MKNTCSTCLFYYQYYLLKSANFIKASIGECTQAQFRLICNPDDDVCDFWQDGKHQKLRQKNALLLKRQATIKHLCDFIDLTNAEI